MKTCTTKVLENKKLKENNFLIRLTKPEGFKFKAGQFVMLHNKNEEKPFSIASPPSQSSLDFLIKKHPNGAVSPFLHSRKKGDQVEISGPHGTFTIKKPNNEIIFIAAGTGVAPLRSMLVDALEIFQNAKVTLLFGFRSDFFFEKEFRKLEKQCKNFRLFVCSSGSNTKSKCVQGRVTEHIKKVITSPHGKDAFICGPPKMIKDSVKILKELNFKKEQIHTEDWV